jgi:hypothetical protein
MIRFNIVFKPATGVPQPPDTKLLRQDIATDLERAGRLWQRYSRIYLASHKKRGLLDASIDIKVIDMGVIRLYGYSNMTGTHIQKGSPPRTITPKRKKYLRFLWEKGPQSSSDFTAFHFYKSVNWPGFKPIPWNQEAFDFTKPYLRAFMKATAIKYAQRFKTKQGT